jgi:hypothetical protein
MEKIRLTQKDNIFSTGVFLKPEKCIINGKEQWRWIAVGFEDDCYLDGQYVDVYDYADTLEGLIIPEANELKSL